MRARSEGALKEAQERAGCVTARGLGGTGHQEGCLPKAAGSRAGGGGGFHSTYAWRRWQPTSWPQPCRHWIEAKAHREPGNGSSRRRECRRRGIWRGGPCGRRRGARAGDERRGRIATLATAPEEALALKHASGLPSASCAAQRDARTWWPRRWRWRGARGLTAPINGEKGATTGGQGGNQGGGIAGEGVHCGNHGSARTAEEGEEGGQGGGSHPRAHHLMAVR